MAAIRDIGRALIVEDDASVAVSLKKLLENNGVAEVTVVGDGKEAWKELATSSFDLVFLDWKLPALSGLALLNRMRRHKTYQLCPVLIISGYLRKNDTKLLEEFPFTGMVGKPFNSQLLIHELNEVLGECRAYEKDRVLIDQLEQMILQKDRTKSLAMMRAIIAKMPPLMVSLTCYAARNLRQRKELRDAEQLLLDALKKHPTSLPLLTEMGKVLIQQQRHRQALSILQKAQSISKDNVERLCLLGEAHLNVMEIAEAANAFEEASHIDTGDRKVKAGQLLANNARTFLEQNAMDNIPVNFASLLNAIGVSMVKSEDYTKGIEHYQSAMGYVSDDDTKARLAYNLGLGHFRWKKPDDAIPWLQKSLEFSQGRFNKARETADRISEQFGIPRIPAIGEELLQASRSSEQTSLDDNSAGFAAFMADSDQTVIPEQSPIDHDNEFGNFDGDDLFAEGGSGGFGSQDDSDFAANETVAMKRAGVVKVEGDDAESMVPVDTIDPYTLFTKEIPDGQRLVKMLEESGCHVSANLNRIAGLLKRCTRAELEQAVAEAVRRGTPEAAAVSFLVSEQQKQKKAG